MPSYSKLLLALVEAFLLLEESREAGDHALSQTREPNHRLSLIAQRNTGLQDNLGFVLPEDHYSS